MSERASVTLREINEDNRREAEGLSVADDQKDFVAPNVRSIAEAKSDSRLTPLAIYSGDTMVGFAMHGHEREGRWWIVRLMIDQAHQRKGYGRAATQELIERLKEMPDCEVIGISYDPRNEVARRLYASLGFRETGEIMDDELVAEIEVRRGE